MHPDDTAVIQEVMRLSLTPGEVLVFKLKGRATAEQVENVSKYLRRLLGEDHRVLILDDRADLFVIPAPN